MGWRLGDRSTGGATARWKWLSWLRTFFVLGALSSAQCLCTQPDPYPSNGCSGTQRLNERCDEEKFCLTRYDLECTDGICLETCQSSYDCQGYLPCILGVCQNCDQDAQCGTLAICTSGLCGPKPCTVSTDCPDGAYCDLGSCSFPSNLRGRCSADDGCLQGLCIDSNCLLPCITNVDCSSDDYCHSGGCRTRVPLGDRCDFGEACSGGACVAGTCCPFACTYGCSDETCLDPVGQQCFDALCAQNPTGELRLRDETRRSWPDVATRSVTGSIVVVWMRTSTIDDGVSIVARLDEAGAALATITVDQWSPMGATEPIPTVAMAPDGTFMVVWPRDNGTDTDVWYRSFASDGVAVAGPARVNVTATGDGNQGSPALAADGLGRFIVVWSGSPSVGLGARVYDPVQSDWGNELALATDTGAHHPAVAAYDTGFVATWLVDFGTAPGSDDDLLAGRFDFAGTPQGAPVVVPQNNAGPQREASVAAAVTGAFVVSWTGPAAADGSVIDVIWRRFNADGTPATGDIRAGESFATTRHQSTVGLGGGEVVVIWRNEEILDSPAGLRARRWDMGNSPQSLFFVGQCECLVDSRPRLAVDASGQLAVTWEVSLPEDGTVGAHVQTFDSADLPLARW